MLSIRIIVSVFVIFALTRAYLQYKEHNISLTAFVFWVVLWSGILVILQWPDLIETLSEILGVGRSIDALVYLAITFLFYLMFRSYIKIQDLEQEITQIVRKLALKEMFQNTPKK